MSSTQATARITVTQILSNLPLQPKCTFFFCITGPWFKFALKNISSKRFSVPNWNFTAQKFPSGIQQILVSITLFLSIFSIPNFCGSYWKPWREKPSSWRCLVVSRTKIYCTNSPDDNCIEVEIQEDRNFYVDLRQIVKAFKLKFVEGRRYRTYNTKKIENNAKMKQKRLQQLRK